MKVHYRTTALLAVGLGLVALVGCASQYKNIKKELPPVSESEGMILFYRSGSSGEVFNPIIRLDGKCLGTLQYPNISSVRVSPGSHTVTTDHSSDLTLAIAGGETKYVRIASTNDFFKATQTLSLVSEADSEKEIENLNYAVWTAKECR